MEQQHKSEQGPSGRRYRSPQSPITYQRRDDAPQVQPLRQTVDEYRAALQRMEPLSDAEHARLADIAGHGDLNARNRLCESLLQLVWLVAGKYADGDDEQLVEYIALGLIGAKKAVNRYIERRGSTDEIRVLPTYAKAYIRAEILQHLEDTRFGIVSPSNELPTQVKRVDEAFRVLAVELKREPSVAEVAAYTGFTAETVRVARQYAATSDLSLETDVGTGSGRERGAIPAELIINGPNAEAEAAEVERQEGLQRRVADLIARAGLNELELNALSLFFGLDGRQERRGDLMVQILGHSQRDVSSALTSAKRKLKTAGGAL